MAGLGIRGEGKADRSSASPGWPWPPPRQGAKHHLLLVAEAEDAPSNDRLDEVRRLKSGLGHLASSKPPAGVNGRSSVKGTPGVGSLEGRGTGSLIRLDDDLSPRASKLHTSSSLSRTARSLSTVRRSASLLAYASRIVLSTLADYQVGGELGASPSRSLDAHGIVAALAP